MSTANFTFVASGVLGEFEERAPAIILEIEVPDPALVTGELEEPQPMEVPGEIEEQIAP